MRVLDRRMSAFPGRTQAIDAAIAGDRDQPGDRARPGRVKSGGPPPNGEVNVLQHVLGLASVT